MSTSSTHTDAAPHGKPESVSVQERIERNPYLALASAASIGWVIGRRLRLPLLGAFAGIAVRLAAASIMERVVTDLTAPSRDRKP